MTLPIWLDNPQDKVSEEVDIAIVGGGTLGAGAAYWLSRRNGLRLAIINAGDLASSASGRNAGFVLRGIQSYYNAAVKRYGRETARFIYSFCQETLGYLEEVAQSHGSAFDWQPCGSYLLASSLEELNDLDESGQLMREDGFEVEFLKEDPLERDFYGALFNACDRGLHPVKLVRHLVALSGARVLEREPVSHISTSAGGTVVHTAKRNLACQKVLLVTNAHTPLLEPWFAEKMQVVRGQILVTQPLKKRILERLCYANYGWEYFRQLPDGRLLLGGCRELFLGEEVGYANTVSGHVQTALEHYMKDRFPDVYGVPIDYRFAGTMAFTTDGLPLVGELRKRPGVFFAVGFNGHGLGYSLSMSKLLVEMALDGQDAKIFDANRLGAKNVVPVPPEGP